MHATSAQLQADLVARGYTVNLSNVNDWHTCALTAGPTPDINGKGVGELNAVRNVRRALDIGDHELLQGASNDAGAAQQLYDLLDRTGEFDYGNVNGPVTLDFSNGNGFTQKLTLTASLVANDITILLPAGLRKITLDIVQDATGGWEIPPAAWTVSGGGVVNWGSKGAPTFAADGAGATRCIAFDYRSGVNIRAHYETNIF